MMVLADLLKFKAFENSNLEFVSDFEFRASDLLIYLIKR